MKFRFDPSGWFSTLKLRLTDPDEFAQNRRYIAADTYAFNIAANLAGGSFFTGYLLLLHADDSFLGLVTMAALFGNFLQMLAPLLLNRFPRRRKLLIGARAIYLLVNIVLIGAAQFLPIPSQLVFILSATFVMNAVASLTSPGVTVWQIRSIPVSTRVRFFSFINVSVNVLMYVAILAGSRMVDVFKSQDQEMLGLTILRGVALVVAVLDLLAMTRVREYPEPTAPAGFKALLAPFRAPKYLVTVAVTCLWSFGANLTGPYFTAYLLQDIGIEYTVLNLVGAFGVVVMALATPFWTRRVERMDLFKAFRMFILFYSLHYFVIALTTKDLLLIYPLAAMYAYFMATGLNIVMANMPFLNMPEEDRTTSIAFYAAMNSVAALFGVLVGREFVRRTTGVAVEFAGLHLGNRQLVLYVAGSVLFLSALFLKKKTPGKADGEPAA
jgi:MFS family permease